MMRLSSHGAAKQVTGSCHLVECGDRRVLVDCGLFQGSHEIEDENAHEFGFDPASIDALLLTHAHLDHCGRIPLLVKRGFRGEILCTPPTRELARLVLVDAAGLEEEEAGYRRRRAGRHADETAHGPLFTLDDTFHAMEFFGRSAHYDEPLEVVPGIRACFVDAGHILGSASVLLELQEGETRRSILFSGDLGNPGRPILRDPTPAPTADYVVMETTYGDRPHRPVPASVDELHEAVSTTLARHGNVIIPTFALERAQEILYYLHAGMKRGRLPAHVPVFLDSPMAISATEIFRRYPGYYRDSFRAELGGDDPFDLPGLHFTRQASESMAINNIEGGAVILAGSGMCTGGRVRHHLKHNLWRQRSSVVFVGYAAEGTLARHIIDGAHSARIFQDEIAVRAQIWTINGFSAHAGRDALLQWLAHAGSPRRVFLVHGDYDRGMRAMGEALDARGIAWQMPGMHEPIRLD